MKSVVAGLSFIKYRKSVRLYLHDSMTVRTRYSPSQALLDKGNKNTEGPKIRRAGSLYMTAVRK